MFLSEDDLSVENIHNFKTFNNFFFHIILLISIKLLLLIIHLASIFGATCFQDMVIILQKIFVLKLLKVQIKSYDLYIISCLVLVRSVDLEFTDQNTTIH